jgi:hypothetical protein
MAYEVLQVIQFVRAYYNLSRLVLPNVCKLLTLLVIRCSDADKIECNFRHRA